MQLRQTQFEEEPLNTRSRITVDEMQAVMRLYDQKIGIEHTESTPVPKTGTQEELPTIGDVAEILDVSETEAQRLLQEVRLQKAQEEAKRIPPPPNLPPVPPITPQGYSVSQPIYHTQQPTQQMPRTTAQNPQVTVVQIVDTHAPLFERFDANRGAWLPTWNWGAFLFGWLWYLYKGMWAKGFIYMFAPVFITALSGGVAFPLIPILLGLIGNYDYYLYRRHNSQLWSLSQNPNITHVTLVTPDVRSVTPPPPPPPRTPPITAPPTTSDNITTKFQVLRETYEHNLITREEYEAKRLALLQEMERNAQAKKLEAMLQQLDEAYHTGILTAEEYARKREQILNS
jgi:uncharacterized protein YqgQ